jgi:hypothetical protein
MMDKLESNNSQIKQQQMVSLPNRGSNRRVIWPSGNLSVMRLKELHANKQYVDDKLPLQEHQMQRAWPKAKYN